MLRFGGVGAGAACSRCEAFWRCKPFPACWSLSSRRCTTVSHVFTKPSCISAYPIRLICRRHHGAPDTTTTAVRETHEGRRNTTDDANAPPESAGAEGAVRGGQLFGHLAGRGGGGSGGSGGGYGSGDDGSDQLVGMMRADSDGSELAFGMELSGVREES